MTLRSLCIAMTAIVALLSTHQALFADEEQLRAEMAELRAALQAQEAQLRELRQTDDENWLTERRAEAIRAIVEQTLADSELRAALHDGAVLAGWDNGFFLKSADGNNLLRIKGMILARYVFNHRTDSDSDDDRGGFELARTRFGFSGHVVDPSWQYAIWTGHNNTGGASLLDVYVRKVLDNGLSVTAGQFKVPFWREWLVSETKQQFVERSLLNSFSGGYTQGLKLDYESEAIHLTAALTDGAGAINTPWQTEDTEYSATVRGEWLVSGDWKDYADWQSWPDGEPLVVLGAAAHYQLGEYGTATDEADNFRWTVDASTEFGGANLFAAALGSHTTNGLDSDAIGALVQGGVFVSPKVELIARYEWADLDLPDAEDISVVTVGMNYFVKKHRVRFTADVSYAFDGIAPSAASSFAGYMPDAVGEEDQVVGRAQVQLTF